MSEKSVELYTALEVSLYFMEHYYKACLADLEIKGDEKNKKIFIENFDRVFSMFDKLKTMHICKLPDHWLSNDVSFDIIKDIYDNENIPELMYYVMIAQQEVLRVDKKLDRIVFSRNGVGRCQQRYLDIAFMFKHGGKTFISNSSQLLREMDSDQKIKTEYFEELKQYL